MEIAGKSSKDCGDKMQDAAYMPQEKIGFGLSLSIKKNLQQLKLSFQRLITSNKHL